MRRPVRNSDPSTSHIAEAAQAPRRGSKREAVLAYLKGAKGEWVNAPELATPEVGGFAGTRRLRELRDMGWDIETRQSPDNPTVWQHRLVPSSRSLPPSRRASPSPTSVQVLPASEGKRADRKAAARQRGKAPSTQVSANKAALEARVAAHKARKAARDGG